MYDREYEAMKRDIEMVEAIDKLLQYDGDGPETAAAWRRLERASDKVAPVLEKQEDARRAADIDDTARLLVANSLNAVVSDDDFKLADLNNAVPGERRGGAPEDVAKADAATAQPDVARVLTNAGVAFSADDLKLGQL